MKRFSLLTTVLLLVLPLAALAATANVAGNALTPGTVQTLFDQNAMLIMFVWGILHTRLPALAKVPNALVPWVNAIGYILTKLMVPDAQAGALGALGHGLSLAWIVARGGATSALTSLLYDKFFKAGLDAIVPKAVPAK